MWEFDLPQGGYEPRRGIRLGPPKGKRAGDSLSGMAPTFRLEGVFSVLPTAFHDDGSLDVDGTAALVRAHVAAGVAGLTSLGVMGEAAELSEAERAEVLSTVLGAADDRPVVVGVTGPTRDIVSDRAIAAADAGVAGVMVEPDGDAAVARCGCGGRRAGPAHRDPGLPCRIRRAAERRRPRGGGERGAARRRGQGRGATDERNGGDAPPRRPDLGAVGGLGGLFLIDELRAGATGTMTGLAVPEQLVAIVREFASDAAAAERRWTALLPLIRLEAFPPFNLAARKEVWRLRGVIGSAHCRLAGARIDDRARDDVRRALDMALAAAGAIGDSSGALAGR